MRYGDHSPAADQDTSPGAGSDRRVAFAGLGLMGSAMAGRLLDQGVPLTVYNRTAAKADPLRERGAAVAPDPRSLAADADFVCLMVEDGRAVNSLLSQGMADGLKAGTAVLNFSTVGRQAALSLSAAIESTGATYLDLPVLGSIEPARAGQLLIFAGGDPDTIERCRPVLESLSRRIFYFGAVGQASAMKLIANMLLARFTEALAEVLVLARGFSLDPAQVLEVLQSSALSSPMWEKGKVLVRGAPPLHFPLRHMAKDLRLLDEEVDRLGLTLPAHEAVLEAYLEAAQSGLGDRDYSEILRVFEQSPGAGNAGSSGLPEQH